MNESHSQEISRNLERGASVEIAGETRGGAALLAQHAAHRRFATLQLRGRHLKP
jgi:hypothetical protein